MEAKLEANVNTKMDADGDKGLLKTIVAGAIGNAVEATDWAIYGLAAPFISRSFFPKGDPLVSLIEAYALFAI